MHRSDADPEAARSGGRRARAAVAAAALVLAAAVPYLGALGSPLLWDDRTLLDNRWLATEADLASVWSQPYWHGTRHATSGLYRPLTVLTLAWSLRLAPSRAAVRAGGIALHAATTLLVWVWLAAVARRLGECGSRSRFAAFAGAALFAVHPLGSEAVLFAVGRAELLAAGFGIAAFLSALHAADRRSGVWTAVSGLLLFLSLASKESAAAWLVVLGAWWALARRREGGRPRLGPVAGVWIGTLFGALLMRAAVVGWAPPAPPWIDNPLVRVDALARAANAVMLFFGYLGKMAFPRTLTVDYGFAQTVPIEAWPWGAPLALGGAAAWVGVALALGRTSRAACFLWCFIPAAFAVTSNAVVLIGTVFAERLAYLPLAGACGLAGVALSRLRGGFRPAALLLALLVVAGGARAAVRAADLREHAAFVEATAAASPRAVKALANVGRSRLRRGLPAEAIGPLERATALWPGYGRAWTLLGEAYEAAGEVARAAEAHERARAALADEAAE